jgi:uncharacterized protein YfdQ (DUF2303 family)
MFDKEAIQQLAVGQSESIEAADEALSGAFDTSGVAALPSDFKLHDLEKYQPNRRRQRGSMATSLLPDFVTFTQVHAETGAMTFVDQKLMRAVAVLNMGTREKPGHCDHTATFAAKATAAYTAMRNTANGQPMKQQVLAEFMEDWPGLIECEREGQAVPLAQAIAAVRRVTIETLQKQESSQQSLQAERSAFESITARGDTLPTHLKFTTAPFVGLQVRSFWLRLAVHTGAKDPLLALRVANLELHEEEMAQELAQLVRESMPNTIPVMVGAYGVTA